MRSSGNGGRDGSPLMASGAPPRLAGAPPDEGGDDRAVRHRDARRLDRPQRVHGAAKGIFLRARLRLPRPVVTPDARMASAPRVVWMPGGTRTEIQLGAEDTAGAFCLLVDQPPAGWELPAHLHRGTAETIHIVAGAFEVEMEGRRIALTAGENV